VAFGRRRQDEETGPAATEVVEEAVKAASGSGPWDAVEDNVPELERIDFGCMLVPIGPGIEVQVNLEASEVDAEGNPVGGKIVAVTVVAGESAMQLQAFAAPKRSGIWDEVRAESAKGILENFEIEAEEVQGPFGTELHGPTPRPVPLTPEVLAEMPDEVKASIPQEAFDEGFVWQLLPSRQIGVDGPRWFLCALVLGAAIENEEQWQVLEDVFSQIVVVRGDSPMPPRELLEFTLPDGAQQAMAAEAEGDEDFDPYERGPEITEIH